MNLIIKDKIYYPELDGLRFFAFLMVFVHHAPLLLDTPFFSTINKFGWMGVDLFLCLSAFLFTNLLSTEFRNVGYIAIKDFYIRRALRIWPLYYIFLLIMLFITIKESGWDANIFQRILGMAVFADNILSSLRNYSSIYASPHLWTLSYEEQFYLVIPWLLSGLFRARHVAKVKILLLMLVIFSFLRAVMIFFSVPHPAIWVLPFTHFESVFGGLIVGLGIFDKYVAKISSWVLFLTGCLVLLTVTFLPNIDIIAWNLMISYPLVGLGMTLIIYSFVKEGRWLIKTFMQNKTLIFLGKISYGLYIFHVLGLLCAAQLASAFHLFPQRIIAYPLFIFGSALCLTIIVSALSYQFLEKPFLHLKERFSSVSSRPV